MALDAVSSAANGSTPADVPSLTWSHTVGSGATLLVVYVGNAYGAGKTVTSVTYNGDAMTQLFDTVGTGGVSNLAHAMFVLENPDVGTANVVVTFDENVADCAAGAWSFTDVPAGGAGVSYGTAVQAQGTTTTPTVNVTVTVGSMVVGGTFHGRNDITSFGADQSIGQWQRATVGSDANVGAAGSAESATGTTVTHSYSIAGQSGFADVWMIGALEVMQVDPAPIEQEGFRWGVDDDTESAHTFEAAQDTSISVAADETRLLRVLLNATGDPPATAYTLRSQKNGSGGYVAVPVGASTKPSPTIVSGDVTEDGDNGTTPASPWLVARQTLATGDALILVLAWDDSVDNTGVTIANGPNGEVWTQINSVVASASTEVRLTAYVAIATGTWGAGDISITPNANEQWTSAVIKLEAGEFDATTIIGASNTRASAAANESSVLSPSLTAGSTDGAGRVIFAAAADQDPQSSLTSGWTQLSNVDRGQVSLSVAVRDAAATDSESISAGAAGWTIASDSWCSLIFIVRAPTVTNEVYVTPSANITAGGEATTARLTAPSGKTTGDFTTGRRWDDENGADSIDIAADFYTEVEWAIHIASSASPGDFYDFRVYKGGSAADTYTLTPRWTIPGGGATGRGRLIGGKLVGGNLVAVH